MITDTNPKPGDSAETLLKKILTVLAEGSGGGGVWGSITGTLSDQTDLQAALASKADAASTQAALASKADEAATQAALASKADAASTQAALASKADAASTQAALDTKATISQATFTQIQVAVSDETTALSEGNGKVTFRLPTGFTLTEVRASLTTAQTSGNILTVDINQNGSSILSTKLTIDNTSKTSVGATTPPVISTSQLIDDAEITIDIDQVGDGTATGLKVTLIGNRT